MTSVYMTFTSYAMVREMSLWSQAFLGGQISGEFLVLFWAVSEKLAYGPARILNSPRNLIDIYKADRTFHSDAPSKTSGARTKLAKNSGCPDYDLYHNSLLVIARFKSIAEDKCL